MLLFVRSALLTQKKHSSHTATNTMAVASCSSIGKNNLDGFIPKEIGLLTELRELSLHSNSLKGLIPDEMTSLHDLCESTWAVSFCWLLTAVCSVACGSVIVVSVNSSYPSHPTRFSIRVYCCLLFVVVFIVSFHCCPCIDSVHLEGNQLQGDLDQNLCTIPGLLQDLHADCGTDSIQCSCCRSCCQFDVFGEQRCTDMVDVTER